MALNSAPLFGITIRLFNESFLRKFCCCVSHTKFSYLQFFWVTQANIWWAFLTAPKMPHHFFFFEFAWCWPSVIIGYNQE